MALLGEATSAAVIAATLFAGLEIGVHGNGGAGSGGTGCSGDVGLRVEVLHSDDVESGEEERGKREWRE